MLSLTPKAYDASKPPAYPGVTEAKSASSKGVPGELIRPIFAPAWRKKLADEAGVLPMSSSQIEHWLRWPPPSHLNVLDISGAGQVKRANTGDLPQIIRAYCTEHGISERLKEFDASRTIPGGDMSRSARSMMATAWKVL
jgi:hypothetical protein